MLSDFGKRYLDGAGGVLHDSEASVSKKVIKPKISIPYDLIREDGRLERICEHGIGHTVGHINPKLLVDRYIWIHGCDGCCAKYKTMPGLGGPL